MNSLDISEIPPVPPDIGNESVLRAARHLRDHTLSVNQEDADTFAAMLTELRAALTASGEALAEAREIIENFCSSGYVPGSGADTKWQERRTAFLATGETK
jgi:hypothetical protein